MYLFDCPSCGASLQSSDDPGGKECVCPKCQQLSAKPACDTAIASAPKTVGNTPATTAVTTPEIAYSSQQTKKAPRYGDERSDDEPKRGHGGAVWFRLGIIGAVLAGFVIVSAAVVVPWVEKIRESAARSQSTNNLMQIALAFQSFHDVNRRFPFNGSNIDVKSVAYSAAASSGNIHSGSWGFQILPFIDQNQLYMGSGKADAWIPRHLRVMPVRTYLCPGRGRPLVEANDGGAWTDYFFNNYLNSPLDASDPAAADARRSIVGVTDGSSNTIAVGHGNISTLQYSDDSNVAGSSNIFQGGTLGTMRAGNDGRRAPTGVTLRRDSDVRPQVGSWGGPFSMGALMAMADGSTRLVAYHADHFSTLLTPDGDD